MVDKYLRLKETLNDEQKKLLVEIDDENLCHEIEQYNKGFADGKRQGLKTAIKIIMGAI